MLKAEYRDIDKSKIVIDDRELSARLGRLCSHTDTDILPIVNAVIKEAEPKYAVRSCPISIDGAEVTLGFGKVKSKALAKCLSGCSYAYVFALTLGIKIDRMISKLFKICGAEALTYDAVASALAESMCDVAQAEICGDEIASSRFSVGYGDFSLNYQSDVLDYLGAPTYLGITLTDSHLMVPFKTITAIVGVKTSPV